MKLTLEQVETWWDELGAARPKPETREVLPAYPVKSVGALPVDAGVMLRVVMQDGGSADIVLNPVAALALHHALRIAGQDAGWLDSDCAIIVEAPDGQQRWKPV